MRSRFVRWLGVVASVLFALVSTGNVAQATVTGRQLVRETFLEEFTDTGCHQQVTVRIEGDRLIHEVDVNGGIQTGVTERGTASFVEEGQAFTGGFTRTFSISLPADGAVVVTQGYTVVLHDPEGDTAELHVTAHATVLADGSVTVAYAIVHQSCTAG